MLNGKLRAGKNCTFDDSFDLETLKYRLESMFQSYNQVKNPKDLLYVFEVVNLGSRYADLITDTVVDFIIDRLNKLFDLTIGKGQVITEEIATKYVTVLSNIMQYQEYNSTYNNVTYNLTNADILMKKQRTDECLELF